MDRAAYDAVRTGVGALDCSELGRLAICGPDRYTWLQGMVSNDTRLLTGPQPYLPAFVLDPTGHILSDVALVDVGTGSAISVAVGSPVVLLELPAVNLQKISAVLDRLLVMEDVTITDATASSACLSLQGPGADAALERLRPLPALAGATSVRTDRTGSGGWSLYLPLGELAVALGAARQIGPVVDAQTADLLRIEAGIPIYGRDMDETTLAMEAGQASTHISLTKGCYVGQEIVARIEARGHTNRKLTGLLSVAGGPLAPGVRLMASGEGADASREVGRITSAAPESPATGGRPIALGYVRREHLEPGSRLLTTDGVQVEVTPLPFYRAPRGGA